MSNQRGFTLLELLIAIAIIGILASISVATYNHFTKKAYYAATVAECREIYRAFLIFHLENGMYPNASSAPKFDTTSFSPLDYAGNVRKYLLNTQADKYDSPDDQGSNQEFWVRMTLKADNSIQFVVAKSDNVDLEPGVWLDGVFVYRDGVRAPI